MPAPLVVFPEGQSRQEEEAGSGWYWPILQAIQPPAIEYLLPAGQTMQSDSDTLPVLVVTWAMGQSRQEEEPGADWYFDMGQEAHCSVRNST